MNIYKDSIDIGHAFHNELYHSLEFKAHGFTAQGVGMDFY
jgi:hypothetical protein